MPLDPQDEKAIRHLEEQLRASDPSLAERLRRRPAAPAPPWLVALCLFSWALALAFVDTADGGALGTLALTLTVLANIGIVRFALTGITPDDGSEPHDPVGATQ